MMFCFVLFFTTDAIKMFEKLYSKVYYFIVLRLHVQVINIMKTEVSIS